MLCLVALAVFHGKQVRDQSCSVPALGKGDAGASWVISELHTAN